MPLRLKSPSRPWPTASWSNTPGQPGPSTTVISPAGAATDSRFTSACASAMSIARFHCRRLEQAVVEIAAADPVEAGFAAVARLGDDRDVEPDQGADVAGDEAVGADDLDHAPASDQRDADLLDPRVARSRGGIDLLAQRDLAGERDRRQRVVRAVHRLVGARRRRGGRALGRIEQAQGRRGAVDRGDAQFIGVGEGGGFAASPRAGRSPRPCCSRRS